VVAFLSYHTEPQWLTVSFPSTLYLHPVLDVILRNVPKDAEAPLRLGLQEALVNAAKHGNQLDPSKFVSVRFAKTPTFYQWVITDQGSGFSPPEACPIPFPHDYLPGERCECGRGLFILFQIFDQVQWNSAGTELHLTKSIRPAFRFLAARS
jgi:anti-sigma regulatory factor (Ser/Thr protein kinase)